MLEMPVGAYKPKHVKWSPAIANFSTQTSGHNGSSIWRGPAGMAPNQPKYIPAKQTKNR